MSAATADGDLAAVSSFLHPETVSRGERIRALIQVVRNLATTVRGPAALWLIIAILTGLVPPFQLWASGRLVTSITSRIDGDAGGNPWFWAGLMAGVLVLARVLAPVAEWAMSLIRERGVPELQSRILVQATAVDLATLEYQAFHDTTQRIAEQARDSLQKLISDLRQVVTATIPAIGTAILIARMDWRLMAVLILPLAPILLEAMRSGSAVWTTLTNQTRDRRLAAYLASRFSDRQAAKEIRLFGLREMLLDRWAHHFMATRNELRWKTTRMNLRLRLSGTIADVISYAGFIWILTGTNTSLTPGEIIVLMGAFMTIGNQAYGIQEAAMGLGRSSGFAHDIRSFLRLPAPFSPDAVGPDTIAPTRAPLVASNLRFAYPGTDRPVINGITLTVPPGQVVAIVGENGAGKTTLLKLLLGLYTPDAGEVCHGDRPLSDMPVGERQARFSAVFQQFSRYPLTLAENVTLQTPWRQADLDRAIGDSGLTQAVADAPDGLDAVLSPDLGGTDLSGGQWQRVAIARAGYRNADVLALDEPTAALDPLAEVDIFRRFAMLAEGRTTMLVSHRLGMARLADRIIVIEHGRITEDGTHDELLALGGHYTELWEMQARWYL